MTTKETDAPAMTAAEYKAGLPTIPSGRGIAWTMEAFEVCVNLLFPHVTVVSCQEWKGVNTKYKFLCEKHGQYEAAAHVVLKETTGCRCKGCSSDKKTASAGTLRSPRASKEEKDLAAKLRAEGLSYSEIGRQLGRSQTTIQKWLNPEYRENQSQSSTKWRSENREQHNANARRYYKQFEHGRANSNACSATRRLLKTNTPEFVFLDNQCHEVDREKTYRIFKDFLLPPSEKKAIQELYLEAQHLTETTGVEQHVDHIQPLSKGGEHTLINLQILTADENLSKGNNFRTTDAALICKRLFDI